MREGEEEVGERGEEGGGVEAAGAGLREGEVVEECIGGGGGLHIGSGDAGRGHGRSRPLTLPRRSLLCIIFLFFSPVFGLYVICHVMRLFCFFFHLI